jgi:hypothetical protein
MCVQTQVQDLPCHMRGQGLTSFAIRIQLTFHLAEPLACELHELPSGWFFKPKVSMKGVDCRQIRLQ